MTKLRISFLLLALVGLVAVSGCGGDDEESTSTSGEVTLSTTESTTEGEALTVEEYATEAQTILIDFGTAFTALGTEIQSSQGDEQFQELVGQAETEIQGAIDDFGALQPPEEAQEGHDQILAALEDFSSKLTDVSDAASSGDETALQEAATQLQSAGLDFQEQLTQAAQSLTEAGVDLGGGGGQGAGG